MRISVYPWKPVSSAPKPIKWWEERPGTGGHFCEQRSFMGGEVDCKNLYGVV